MPSFDIHSLFGYSTLTNSPGTAGTSFTVQPGDGVLFASGQNVTLWPANVQPTKANAEIGRITALPATTIAAASNGVALPTGTITVASTTGFPSSGTMTVVTSGGNQVVTYTGTTATTFTGCTGGTGTMATGGAVTSDTLTLTRAQEGTTAKNAVSGWQIDNSDSPKVFTDIENAISQKTVSTVSIACAGSRHHP